MLSIKQAKTTTKKLGHNLRKFEQTDSGHEIPFVKGKWRHGLSDEDKETVENYFGHSFDTPEGNIFWGNYSFKLNHMLDGVDLKNNPEDLLKVSVLKANGHMANSLTESINEGLTDFVLYDEEEEVAVEASYYQKKDEAVAKLFKLRDTSKYCIAIAKYLLPISTTVQNLEKAYVKLHEYIDGKIVKGKNQSVTNFLRALEADKENLYITVDVNDSIKFNIIRKNNSNKFYNPLSGTEYGRNIDETVAFLKNPKNQDELGTGKSSDKAYSIPSSTEEFITLNNIQ